MDECDTAAVMFDCAKNKEPDMITNMIMASELNSTAVCERTVSFAVVLKSTSFHQEDSPMKRDLGVCMTTSDYPCIIKVCHNRSYFIFIETFFKLSLESFKTH
jgi:hypothetical protein